jgi:hypothetical protein
MKKILFILAIIFSLPLYADYHLVIEMNNSKEHSYSLLDKPVISFENNKMVIKTTEIEISYNIADIVKYYFSDVDDTGINDINEDVNKIHFTYTNPDFLLIEGIAGKDEVRVYDTSGRECVVNSERNDNCIKVEFNGLPKGIYIIKVNNHSFKIIR